MQLNLFKFIKLLKHNQRESFTILDSLLYKTFMEHKKKVDRGHIQHETNNEKQSITVTK